jgi:hypothetical protein
MSWPPPNVGPEEEWQQTAHHAVLARVHSFFRHPTSNRMILIQNRGASVDVTIIMNRFRVPFVDDGPYVENDGDSPVMSRVPDCNVSATPIRI